MTYKTTGFKAWERAIDPKLFGDRLKKEIKRANGFNGKLVEGRMRKTIQEGSFKSNAALTTFIKGSAKPLVDDSDLYQAITSVSAPEAGGIDEVFIGIKRSDHKNFNIALAVHEGYTLKVTPKMRGLFFFLWKASEDPKVASKLTGRAKQLFDRRPGGWKPLGKETTAITTPARRFVEVTFNDAALEKQVRDNWERAIQAAMK